METEALVRVDRTKLLINRINLFRSLRAEDRADSKQAPTLSRSRCNRAHMRARNGKEATLLTPAGSRHRVEASFPSDRAM